MYKGRTLTELAKELGRQSNSKKDFKAPTSLMELSVDRSSGTTPQLEFAVGNQFTGPLTELMHDQIGAYLKIPAAYYDRCRTEQPGLLAANVNVWLKSNRETRLVRTMDDRARAFLSARYRMLDNDYIANTALPILVEESKKLGGIRIVSSDVTDQKLYIKAISNRLTFEVKKGDVVSLGIVVSNSEVGLGSVRVEPFLERKICDNGAIIEEFANRSVHLGRISEELEMAERVFRDETRKADDRAFAMKLQDLVRAAFADENFEKLKGITIDAATRKIKAPVQDVVERVSKYAVLSDGHRKSFLQNLVEGGDLTQWGVANAITAIANKAENYEMATRLEKIGGNLMTMPLKAWDELGAAA